jgi:glycosyltransferase involved in cell wall biosynthesis
MHVSVIIPLYNKAAHIMRTLDCVFAQTHGDFEIIVVDDGSTDGGADVVRGYTDPRVRLIQQANAGVSAARNRGIAEAHTNLLSFLDADDEWSNDFLETVLNLRKKFPDAGVWGTAYTMINANGTLSPVQLLEEVRRQKDGMILNFFLTASVAQPIHASSMLVRKDAMLKAGGFQVGLARLEDTLMLFCLALRYPFAFCPVSKTFYRMDAENRTDTWLWSGNFPFYAKARAFLNESTGTHVLSDDAQHYLGCYHTGGLYRNWLAGNPDAMREIISDCQGIRGYRLKCLLWRLLLPLPHSLVLRLWRWQSKLRGGSGQLPPVRSIYRIS